MAAPSAAPAARSAAWPLSSSTGLSMWAQSKLSPERAVADGSYGFVSLPDVATSRCAGQRRRGLSPLARTGAPPSSAMAFPSEPSSVANPPAFAPSPRLDGAARVRAPAGDARRWERQRGQHRGGHWDCAVRCRSWDSAAMAALMEKLKVMTLLAVCALAFVGASGGKLRGFVRCVPPPWHVVRGAGGSGMRPRARCCPEPPCSSHDASEGMRRQ